MTNTGTVRTQQELWHDALHLGQPTRVSYFQFCKFDASPAAQEVFINGVAGQRLWLPTDSAIIGTGRFIAWNVSDNDRPAGAIIDFMAENDGGAVTFTPANLSGTDGNPIRTRHGLYGDIVIARDDTNKAIIVNFTGVASQNYFFRGYIDFTVATAKSRNENFYTATT